jgi:hypothetical protein
LVNSALVVEFRGHLVAVLDVLFHQLRMTHNQ